MQQMLSEDGRTSLFSAVIFISANRPHCARRIYPEMYILYV